MGRMWDLLIILVQRKPLKKILDTSCDNSHQLPPKKKKNIIFPTQEIYRFNDSSPHFSFSQIKLSHWNFYSNICVFIFRGVFRRMSAISLLESDSAFSKILSSPLGFNLQCSHARMNFLGHEVTLWTVFNKTRSWI